ncbi:MAG TPA: hypothetical protein PK095_04955 [Myxococcota bacterium]|nr:hypothetical protein [Myxococcota bacterium]
MDATHGTTVVLDACVALNLLATRREVEVVEALDVNLLLPERAAREVRYLWTPEDQDGERHKEPASLERLLGSGRLQICTLDETQPTWLEAFMDVAGRIGDPDAACLTLAGVRGCPLWTDDFKAGRLAHELYPGLELDTTLGVLRRASLALGWSPTELRQVAFDLYHRGNFDAPRRDRHRQWYLELLA